MRYQRFSRDTSSLRASPSCGRADLAFLFRSIGMNAISWYVMSSSWVFLVGWIVVLLVAGMAVFGGDAGRGEFLFSLSLWVSSTHTKNFAIAGFAEKLSSSRKLKLGLVKSHLEAHAAQELAPTASLF